MLITCDGCGAKIRVPDSAAGKRAKCPKCATIVNVPDLDNAEHDPDAEDTRVSAKPLPPPAPIEVEPLDEEEKTKVTSAGAKPPKPTGPIDDDEDDEDDRPVRKRRRMDEDEDDYLDVRSDRRTGSRANNLATTAMTLGIVSLVMSTIGGCCCGIFGAIIAIICGGLALVFGFMGREPGSDGTAMTGIICGGIGLALGLLVLILGIFWIGFNLAGGPQGMFNIPKG
jgi:predicted Zn finger-like uncharacterized protein